MFFSSKKNKDVKVDKNIRDTTPENPARRSLLKGKISLKPEQRLPWVIDEKTFTSKCTQCSDCIDVCETKIIVKDSQGFPKIDFSKGECTFCNKCIDTCNEPLFLTSEEQKQKKPWPINVNISHQCLAKNSIYCQSCRDECEPNAIKFIYIKDGQPSSIPQPQLNTDDCTQCGACISKCPQNAITANFNEVS